MTAGFDWMGFEDALVDRVVAAVRARVASVPSERVYVAALDRVYRETDGVIRLPYVGIDSAEALERRGDKDRHDRRWNAADWEHFDDELRESDAIRSWEHALTAHACRGSRDEWLSTFDQYISMLVRVCQRSATVLRTDDATDEDFIVVLLDEDSEILIRRTLTEAEVSRHFPALDQHAAEVARIRALPPSAQAEYYVSRLGRFDGLINSEEAESSLRNLGAPAIPALLPMLNVNNQAWQAARLLADIGDAGDDVVHALDSALTQRQGADQAWVARALSRLGRLDRVLHRANHLPEETVITAVAAPYSSFRDHGVHPLPLDYRPLENFIEGWPQHVPALADELKPGSPCCEIGVDEVDEAVRGLSSPHVIIRQHAVCVLGERALGEPVARTVLPILAQVVGHDPDANVRRLAILSLLWWRNDSRPYTEAIRAALHDPAVDVRKAAAYWLEAQDANPSDR